MTRRIKLYCDAEQINEQQSGNDENEMRENERKSQKRTAEEKIVRISIGKINCNARRNYKLIVSEKKLQTKYTVFDNAAALSSLRKADINPIWLRTFGMYFLLCNNNNFCR